MRGDKFEHIEKMKAQRGRDKNVRSGMVEKLRTLFAGFTDDELAILFPALRDELNAGKKEEK